MNKNKLGLKLISALVLITGLFAIKSVISEILELGTISTPLRICDIIIRALIAIISPFVAYGIWKIKNWGFVTFFPLAALHIALRSLIFLSPHFTLQNKINNAIGIIIFLIIAIYIYTGREAFKKNQKYNMIEI
jgi:hypothetical protein